MYSSEVELKLFEREVDVLHHLNQVSREHPHLVRAIDAKMLEIEPKVEQKQAETSNYSVCMSTRSRTRSRRV